MFSRIRQTLGAISSNNQPLPSSDARERGLGNIKHKKRRRTREKKVPRPTKKRTMSKICLAPHLQAFPNRRPVPDSIIQYPRRGEKEEEKKTRPATQNQKTDREREEKKKATNTAPAAMQKNTRKNYPSDS